MSFPWWLWGGVGTASAPDPEDAERNPPMLWSGGWVWADADDLAATAGQTGYWQASANPQTGRTGPPDLCVAIAGRMVLEQLRSASWSLGRSDWLSVLSPTSASLSFVDVPAAKVGDDVVISLMSDTKQLHSDALWVGRVDAVRTSRDLSGFVTSTISATDVVGVLGKAEAPASLPAGHTLKTLVEGLAATAGVSLKVDADPLATLATLLAVSDNEGTVLDLVNRAERSSNALLFLRGSGRLYAAIRDATGASSARVVTLDGPNSASSWDTDESLGNVITRWRLGDGSLWETDTAATTLLTYGDQTYSATDLLVNDPAPYADLIASDVMAYPRPIVTGASFPIADLAQDVLYLDPLDRVVDDGTTWQVMSVRHEVTPIEVEDDGRTRADWRVTITADATQEALAGAPEPGPVEPPALDTVTQAYVSTKAATAEREKDGDATGSGSGPLLVGRFSGNGSRYRSAIEWAIVPPANAVRVVSAKVRIKTAGQTTGDARVSVRRNTVSWSEGSMTWPGPNTSTTGERFVSIPAAGNRYVEFSVTGIAQGWFDHGNDGLRLTATNEDSTNRFCTFHSDDASDPADRPRLTIVWEVVS